MEWLALLKFITDAENAETIEQLQAQVTALGQAHNRFVDGTMGIALVIVVCWICAVVTHLVMIAINSRKIKRLEAKAEQVDRLQEKLDKLLPLIEKATGSVVV